MFQAKYKFILTVILLLSLSLVFSFTQNQKDNTINTAEVLELSMIAGGPAVQLEFNAGESLFQVMKDAELFNKLTFVGKNYPALGFFVTEINDLKHGDGGNLLYYVNGEEAQVGVLDYFPRNGDVVEWKLQ